MNRQFTLGLGVLLVMGLVIVLLSNHKKESNSSITQTQLKTNATPMPQVIIPYSIVGTVKLIKGSTYSLLRSDNRTEYTFTISSHTQINKRLTSGPGLEDVTNERGMLKVGSALVVYFDENPKQDKVTAAAKIEIIK